MERSVLEQHLALAEKHVTTGEDVVERQRSLLAELAREGHDTASAAELLNQFIATLAVFVADRDRLRDELAQAL